MTFNEAVEEMKRLAEGRVWAFEYEVSSYFPVPRIHGYIALVGQQGHAEGSSTYAGAIENVKAMLSLVECDPAPEDGTDTSRPNPIGGT